MQVYKIFVYDYFTGVKIDWLVKAYNINYSIKLNDISVMSFFMDLHDEQTNDLNLKPFNIVKLTRYFDNNNEFRTVFTGVIKNRELTDKSMKLSCVDMLGLLSHRVTTSLLAINGNGGAEILSMLNYTNTQGYTPIISGFNNCIETVDNIEFKRGKISSSILTIQKQTTSDIWIDNDTHALNIGVLGTDKSSTVSFQQDWNRPEQTNVSSYSILDNSQLLASRVIGKSGTLESVKENAITNYPLLETVVSFASAKSQSRLDFMTQRNLDNYNELLSIPRISPLEDRELLEHYWIGDYILIKLIQNNYSLEKVQRIIAINVSVGYNNNETINIETSSGTNRRHDILDVMTEHERRLRDLENN